jgi:hypothetical protein
MSIKLMSAIWDLDNPDGNKLLILLALADMANDEGYCWPSYATIARKTRLSRYSVIEKMKELIKDGWLTKESRFKDDQKEQKSNGYTIHLPKLTEGSQPVLTGGSQPVLTGVVNTGLPESSLNHQLESPIKQSRKKISKPAAPEPIQPADVQEPPAETKPEEDPMGAQEDKVKKDILAAMINGNGGYKDHSGLNPLPNIDKYPEEVRSVIAIVCQLWKLTPPTKGKKGGEFAFWIEQAKTLRETCAEFGLDAIRRVYVNWIAEFHDGMPRFPVSGPGSLIKTTRSTVGIMRVSKPADPNTSTIQPDTGGFYG